MTGRAVKRKLGAGRALESQTEVADRLPQFISRQVVDGDYYFLNLDPAASEEMSVVCGGVERCAAGYALDRSDFPYYGIEYVVAGQAVLTIGGRSYDLRPGSVFGYGPASSCGIASKGGMLLRKHFVDLFGSGVARLFGESPLANGGAIDLAGIEWVESLFQQLLLFGKREDAVARRSCRLLAETLLLQLGEQEATASAIETPAYYTYLRARRCIEQRYLRLSSAAEVAAATHIDQAYLARLFQRFDEESPYRKLIRLKMSHAAAALLGGGAAVKEVAAMVGYDDALHFSRVFKRTYGISPAYFPASVQR